MDIVQVSEQIATEAHKEQLRNYSKQPYIIHPKAVAALVGKYITFDYIYNPNLYRAAAWLHDVIEDTPVTREDLISKLSQFTDYMHVIDAVVLLSKIKGQNYVDYLTNIRSNPIARAVKLADLEHNMSDLKPCNLLDKYNLSVWFLKLEKISD
jgi:(p)ppGpp synthase/HD superfamily hydrolase